MYTDNGGMLLLFFTMQILYDIDMANWRNLDQENNDHNKPHYFITYI